MRHQITFLLAIAALACADHPPLAPRLPRADQASAATQMGGGAIVLRGTVITPDSVLPRGYVSIADGRITAVSDQRPEVPDALVINTAGIILPGFIDLHNHVPWNVLPRWKPSRLYSDPSQWANDPEFQRVAAPFNDLVATSFCDMNTWGELRALVGGATSIMATRKFPCIHGLVRNLDFNSGFYGTTQLNREHIYNVSPDEFPPASDSTSRAQFAERARSLIHSSFYEALAMHVAEGTDAVAEEQFTFLRSQGLLNPKGILIHGVSLGPDDFQAMAATGTALVWSPRSNIELYGRTANISAALDAGVEVALAPDWALTGSSNMLDELKTAAQWNRDQLAGRLTDRQLVEMATAVPARIAGIDDEVGSIRAGLRADLLVINGDVDNPYRAVIRASPADVQLVMIAGVALYGDHTLTDRFWDRADLEDVALPDGPKTLATPAAGLVAAAIAARLQTQLAHEGTALAPLVEAKHGNN